MEHSKPFMAFIPQSPWLTYVHTQNQTHMLAHYQPTILSRSGGGDGEVEAKEQNKKRNQEPAHSTGKKSERPRESVMMSVGDLWSKLKSCGCHLKFTLLLYLIGSCSKAAFTVLWPPGGGNKLTEPRWIVVLACLLRLSKTGEWNLNFTWATENWHTGLFPLIWHSSESSTNAWVIQLNLENLKISSFFFYYHKPVKAKHMILIIIICSSEID